MPETITDAQNYVTALSSTVRAQLFVWMYGAMTNTDKQTFIDYEEDNHNEYIQIDTPEPSPLTGTLHLQPQRGPR